MLSMQNAFMLSVIILKVMLGATVSIVAMLNAIMLNDVAPSR